LDRLGDGVENRFRDVIRIAQQLRHL
jgi:hypothetical protein